MKYDLIIIGGGPAGMMAAGRAGALGARVLLVEKNKNLGVKLLITGNGRCNLTNNSNDLKGLIEKYDENGKFLYSAFNRFGIEDLIYFFESRGVSLRTETGGRVFPVSNKSQDILYVLIDYLKESNVDIKTESSVRRIVAQDNRIEKIVLCGGRELTADKYIICTGGKSYPGTGSSGDAYKWLEDLGHDIIKPRPALASIVLKNNFVKNLEGLSLQNVGFGVYKNNKKLVKIIGEGIFTADGLSGPAVINLSRKIGECLPEKTEIVLDFEPDLSEVEFDKKMQVYFNENNNKDFSNILAGIVPKKLVPIFVDILKIAAEKKVNLITRDERKNLLSLVKNFRLEVKGIAGFEKAMITAGGVDVREVDPKTMRSKIINNLYFAGEILDLDGPTGGYNLQICWSTGFVAGSSVV